MKDEKILEYRIRESAGKNRNIIKHLEDIKFTQEDRNFMYSKERGVLYRLESGGLNYYYENTQEEISAKTFDFLKWGWISIDELILLDKFFEMYGSEIDKIINSEFIMSNKEVEELLNKLPISQLLGKDILNLIR